ncbi:MAG TPA: roadblock/LC7 domain-containing protein [Thermoleophilia bacterium]|nr:roadblock/LC7 domain-containing protein [Thermoleophilia bacterium]
MDPTQALAELKELSTQIEVVLVASKAGDVIASSVAGDRAAELGGAAADLVTMAERVRADLGREALSQLQAATPEGSVFCVVDGDRVALATTGPDPTAGLILYDLKTLLRQIAEDGDQPAAAEPATAAHSEPEPETAEPEPAESEPAEAAEPAAGGGEEGEGDAG